MELMNYEFTKKTLKILNLEQKKTGREPGIINL